MTTGGSELDQSDYVGYVSAIMRVSTSKDGSFSSYFDKTVENNIDSTSLKQILIDNHTIQANKTEMFGQLSVEHIFRLCNTFKKVTKGFGFIITFGKTDLQNIVYTTLPEATVVNVTFDN